MEPRTIPQVLQVENIPEPIISINEQGQIVYMNKAAAEYAEQYVNQLQVGVCFSAFIREEKWEPDVQGASTVHLKDDTGRVLTWEVHAFPKLAGRKRKGYDLFIRDRTSYVRLQELSDEIKACYTQLLDVYLDPIMIIQDERIMFVNEKAEVVMGGTYDQLIGESIHRFIPQDYREQVLCRNIYPNHSEKRTELTEIQVYNLQDEILDVEIASSMIQYKGNPAFMTVMRNITERKQFQYEITHMAYHDALTGLPNRRKFIQQLHHLIEQSNKKASNFAAMAIDIDRFKNINDSLGHSYGDYFLVEMANRILVSLSDCDATVARMGGDEFTILVHQFDDPSELNQIAERITDAVRQPFHLKDCDFYVTTSIGIVIYPQDGMSVEELIKNADSAMYEQKKSGKNGYCFFSHELEAQMKEKVELEGDLRRALAFNELILYYQPQYYAVHADHQTMIGVEALVRWNHPTRGLLTPEQFIPLAEETGFMFEIETWILREACRQMKAWQEQGGPLMPVWVNLSCVQFYQLNFKQKVVQILEETGLDPQYLGLEITEGTMMEPSFSEDVLSALDALGVRISLDDFGTGYSSLRYLQRSAIHRLKIDRSLTKNIVENTSNQVIVSTIIAMARQLELDVIAEGIETRDQLNFLLGIECNDIQGFYFSRPLSARDIEEVLFAKNHYRSSSVEGQHSTIEISPTR